MQILTLTLPRAENALIELQAALPHGARVIHVRYTAANLVCLYTLPAK